MFSFMSSKAIANTTYILKTLKALLIFNWLQKRVSFSFHQFDTLNNYLTKHIKQAAIKRGKHFTKAIQYSSSTVIAPLFFIIQLKSIIFYRFRLSLSFLLDFYRMAENILWPLKVQRLISASMGWLSKLIWDKQERPCKKLFSNINLQPCFRMLAGNGNKSIESLTSSSRECHLLFICQNSSNCLLSWMLVIVVIHWLFAWFCWESGHGSSWRSFGTFPYTLGLGHSLVGLRLVALKVHLTPAGKVCSHGDGSLNQLKKLSLINMFL